VGILLDVIGEWPAVSAAQVAAELGVADVPAVERLLREGLGALVPHIVATRDKIAASLGSPQAGEG